MKIKIPESMVSTCEIFEMSASDVSKNISRLLKLANISQKTNCEIIVMKNQVTILIKK